MKSVVALLLAVFALNAQIAVKNQGYVPFSEEPIDYRSDKLTDPVALLQHRIDSGEVKLQYEPGHGYLKSVLDQLHIDVSSQTLVFSKTSFQYKKISPETPRALYFNDDVYVGQVHQGKVLEFVSFDPSQGGIFYILDEKQSDHPVFQRAELDCTQCHVAAGTRQVPGVLLRSLSPTKTGTQATQAPAYITGQESPLGQRWGGWYVTGSGGTAEHMGNRIAADPEHPRVLSPLADGSFDASAYLIPDSDIVAHLVLAHQTQMHNLITQTNYQTRIAAFKHAPDELWQKPAEELVRYLLFANEASFETPVKGSSSYAAEFSARGPRDTKGRSLRDFDLNTRIFRYPCSYLIYSEAFDALPQPAKAYVYHRLFEVLTGRDKSGAFAKLSETDRKAVLEILLATKPGLPEEWLEFRRVSLR